MYGDLTVLSGRSNRPFAEEVCKHIGIGLADSTIEDYFNGNLEPNVRDSLRRNDVFIIQTGARACLPDEDAATQINSRDLVELLTLIDCAKDTAVRVTAVTPYAFYIRGDKKDKPHIPITAQLIARLIEAAGASRVLAMDLHSMQAQGFYRIPVDQVFAMPRFADRLIDLGLEKDKICVLAADSGSVGRVRRFAGFLRMRMNRDLPEGEKVDHIPFATSEKRRLDKGKSEIIKIVGGESIPGRDVVMIDDETLGGGTLIENANFVHKQYVEGVANPPRIFAAVTHGILSGRALEKILRSPIDKLLVTDTVRLDIQKVRQRLRESPKSAEDRLDEKLDRKLEVVSVADIFAKAILNIHEGKSVSREFEEP